MVQHGGVKMPRLEDVEQGAFFPRCRNAAWACDGRGTGLEVSSNVSIQASLGGEVVAKDTARNDWNAGKVYQHVVTAEVLAPLPKAQRALWTLEKLSRREHFGACVVMPRGPRGKLAFAGKAGACGGARCQVLVELWRVGFSMDILRVSFPV